MNSKDFLTNRKKSFAPGRASTRPTDILGRQLSGGQMNRRATSIGPCLVTKTDPRPTKNPEYVHSCALRVEAFIRSTAPNAVLSPKAFASPTVRDFDVIWETMFSAFDSRWYKKAKGKKVEELVPFVLKGLGYPLAVSKSALSAPGSTHSWPQIILALDWMLDIIQLKSKSIVAEKLASNLGKDQMEMDDKEDGPMLEPGKIFDWLCEGYARYMQFDDDGCKKVDNSLISKLEQDQEIQKQKNQKLQQELDQLTEEVKNLQQAPSPLLKMKAEIDAMEQDEMTFKTKISKLEEVIGRLQKKSSEHEISIEMKAKEIKDVVQEIEKLKERVSKQTVTKEDISRLLNEKQKVQLMLDNAQAHKNSVEQEVNSKEVKLDALVNGLERLVHEYNNRIQDLIPLEVQREIGVEFKLGVNRMAKRAEDTCNSQHKETVTAGLHEVKKKQGQQNHSMVQERNHLEHRHKEQQESILKLQQHHENIGTELEQVHVELQRCKEAIESLKQNGTEQISLLEDTIMHLKEQRTQMIQSVQQRLPQAQATYQEAVREAEREKGELLADLRYRMTLYKKLYDETFAALEKIKQSRDEVAQAVQGML